MPAPCAGDDSDEPSVPNDVSKSEGEGVVARSADSSSGGAVGAGTGACSTPPPDELSPPPQPEKKHTENAMIKSFE